LVDAPAPQAVPPYDVPTQNPDIPQLHRHTQPGARAARHVLSKKENGANHSMVHFSWMRAHAVENK
jgi:hypothetical protein